MTLTQKSVVKLASKPGRYFDANGLYLQVPQPGKVQPRQSRSSWLLRYEINKRERWMGLGSVADFNLKEARERARKARQLLAEGIDPLLVKEAEHYAKQELLKSIAQTESSISRVVSFIEEREKGNAAKQAS